MRMRVQDSGVLSDTTPAAPAGKTLVTWQQDGDGNISGYVPSSGAGDVTVQDDGLAIGTRSKLNFIAGENIMLTIVDDAANGRINITISATGTAVAVSRGLLQPWAMLQSPGYNFTW